MTIEFNMPPYVILELIWILIIVIISIPTIMPGLDRWSRRYFVALYSILAFSGIVFAVDMVTYMQPKTLALSKILPLIEYLIIPLPSLCLTLNIIHCCGENYKKSLAFRAILIIWSLYNITHILAHHLHFFYYTSPTGRFYLKPLHPLAFFPVIVILLIDLAYIIINRHKLSKKYFYAFLFFLVPVTISLLIHSFISSMVILNSGSFIGSFALYILILMAQMEQYTQQQNAIANQNANIMVLKMRPHFIYNTMTSIYYLCEQDPKKAQQIILDFTSYLRKNFNGMVVNDTIPFMEELEHIRAYLAVELAQYEDHLSVEYDTPHTRFKLPPLTLQPLVENSIKHGMDPDSEPLHILIRTMETDAGSVIYIEDNGPGFDPKDVFDTNNALSNIKQRLEMMCQGKISITSVEGDGTVVKVVIPR